MVETTEQYRARINQLKTGIENEPYMVKMRENIAEGIGKTGNRQADIEVRQDTLEDDFVVVQQDASSASPSGAEVAVARGSYSTLEQRLTEEEQKVTAQLAQNKTEGVKVGSNPFFGYFSVNRERTTLDFHAFEDWGILNAVDTGQGYSSFDAKATMTNTLSEDHFVGYQSRNIYKGSGGLASYMHGYDTDMEHSGTGTVKNAKGLYIKDVKGTGTIENDYGIYVNEIRRGSLLNYNIASYGGKNIFTGETILNQVYTNGKQFGLDYGSDELNKEMAIGYGLKGFANAGKIVVYNGQKEGLMEFSQKNVTLVKGMLNFKLLTKNSLPIGIEGAIGYCSNGLKPNETTGFGTGVPIYYSNGIWRSFYTNEGVTI